MRYEDASLVQRGIGLRVKELRRARNLTQASVAKVLGTSVQRVQFIEGGKANLRLSTLIALANVLDTPIESFLTEPTTETVEVSRTPQVGAQAEKARRGAPRKRRSKRR